MAKFSKEQVIEKVKAGGRLAGSCGAEALACGICRAVLPPQLNIVVQGVVLFGGLLLGGFVGEHLGDYVEKTIDETVKEVEDTVQEVKRCVDVIRDNNEETKEEGVG